MAHGRKNLIMKVFRGKSGKLCMEPDGVSGSQPGKSKRKWTENQAKHLSRFECAKEYGRRAVADPLLSAHYAM